MNKIMSFAEELQQLQEAYVKKIGQLEKWTEEQILNRKMSERDALAKVELANKEFSARLLYLHIKHFQGFVETTNDPEDETVASYYGKNPTHTSSVTVSFSPQGLFQIR